jgi:hypothetical protein
MGPLPHGSARTTAAVCRAIQQSQERLAKLAERDDLNPKIVAKWKERTPVHDAPMGPKPPRSTALTREEAALIGAFRKHTCGSGRRPLASRRDRFIPWDGSAEGGWEELRE